MSFIADLHIHSRFSRATSKALTPAHLAAWARVKGIDVLGCGDFTHPAWRAELREKLVIDEASGLYALKDPRIGHALPEGLALPCPDSTEASHNGPLFCMQAEISSIYKKHGKVRKVHNLVYVPTLDDADALSRKLSAIGNLNSDGRPILGLDSRDLLEIVLETCPQAVLIPAHVWTPWFALFGSKSGFDRLEDCFGDLSSHIFALETGLSSDPPMNRMVSALDRYALISNSDAHSGANLGREANLFAGAPGYAGMFSALRASARRDGEDSGGCRFLGTLEFYPEEGKYHLDGHRDCHVVMEPQEAREHGNICPVCGKPLTIGVLHRVLELADRTSPAQLEHEPQQRPLIPLPEVIGELLACGPSTRKAQTRYSQTLAQLGPELDILCHMPLGQIRSHWPELAIAVERLRTGQVYRQGGYDGEYGVVRVFAPDEQQQMQGKGSLFAKPSGRGRSSGTAQPSLLACAQDATEPKPAAHQQGRVSDADPNGSPTAFSPEQQAAMTAGPAPVLVLAGPGSGKTRVLVGRIRHLLANGVEAQRIMALTFTRRAAGEIRQRLGSDSGQAPPPVHCDTLHGLALELLRERDPNIRVLDEQMAFALFARANGHLPSQERKSLWDALALARECMDMPVARSPLGVAAANYEQAKQQMHALDYTGLLESLLACAPAFAHRFSHVLVDEVQDLSALQLSLLRSLLPASGAGLFAIGDPDQSIYGFRGALGIDAGKLAAIWPGLQIHHLTASYRSCQPVLDMAQALFAGKAHCGALRSHVRQPAELHIHAAPDAKAEARWVAQRVQRLLGMTSHTLLDQSARGDATLLDGQLAPGDIAVLVRLKAQIGPLAKALELAGIPCAVPSADEFWQDGFCQGFLQVLAPSLCEDEGMVGAGLPLTGPQQLAEQYLANGQLSGTDADGLALNTQWKALCRLYASCGSWPAFFERLALLREEECVQARAQRVQVLTLHASKGLEFDAVFLPGLEQGLLPLDRAWLFGTNGGQVENGIDEEKRLLYVGLTRAARAIFASHCASRSIHGRTLAPKPSPFLGLIRHFCRQTATRRHSHTTSEQLKLL